MGMRDLLWRGLLAGLLAGMFALGFAELVGEPQVGQAITFEAHQNQQEGNPRAPVVVTRTVQKTVGLALAVVAIGTGFGGLFAIAFAIAYGRIGLLGPRATALVVALGGFFALYLVPFLKYPANPPSVGHADTIGYRTSLYFTMMAFSVVTAVGAVVFGRRLVSRLAPWDATLAAAGAFVAVVAMAYAVMPGVDEVPAAFPAVVLWRFRIASVGTQLVLWAAIGLIFGALTQRTVNRSQKLAPARA